MPIINHELDKVGDYLSHRDFGMSIVAWANYFYTIDLEKVGLGTGQIEFGLTGAASSIFNGKEVSVAFGSGHKGVANGKPDDENSMCLSMLDGMSTIYQESSATVTVDISLNHINEPQDPACTTKNTVRCANPCPNTFPLYTMGFEDVGSTSSLGSAITKRQSNVFSIKVNMNSVLTAIAVNVGMVNLEDLSKIKEDRSLTSLLTAMDPRLFKRYGIKKIGSYFKSVSADVQVSPTYCITWVDPERAPQCLITIDKLLAYPVIKSTGYITAGYLNECTKANVMKDSHKSSKCQEFDINVALIYFPEPYPKRCNEAAKAKPTTTAPKRSLAAADEKTDDYVFPEGDNSRRET